MSKQHLNILKYVTVLIFFKFCFNQDPKKVQTLHLVDVFTVSFNRYIAASYLFSWQFICWRNELINPIEFLSVWILLTALPWCHLPCSSVPCNPVRWQLELGASSDSGFGFLFVCFVALFAKYTLQMVLCMVLCILTNSYLTNMPF